MASSQIYQNFIALNKWAHPLQPDAIISFSGGNEIAVPWTSKGDADQLASYQVSGFLHVPRYSASPRWLKILAQYYPGIVRRTALGSLIRLMYLPDYSDDWDANYFLSRVDPNYRPMPREELQRRYKAALALALVWRDFELAGVDQACDVRPTRARRSLKVAGCWPGWALTEVLPLALSS